MSACRNVLRRVALCGLLLRVSSVEAYTVVSFSGAGAPKAFAGENFGDAVSKGGQRPTYYGSNFDTGFKCPSKVPSSVDPSNKHAHSQAGYLFLYGGSFHAKVSSSWNPPSYYGTVTFHSCKHCRLGGDAIGWDQWSYTIAECATNVFPRWAFDLPEATNIVLDISGGVVQGGSFDLGQRDDGSGRTGSWSENWDMNTPPVWTWDEVYDPEGTNGSPVGAWTEPKVNQILGSVGVLRDTVLSHSSLLSAWYQSWQDWKLANASHNAVVQQFLSSQDIANQYLIDGLYSVLPPLSDIKSLLGQIRDKSTDNIESLLSQIRDKPNVDINYVSLPDNFNFDPPDISSAIPDEMSEMLGTLEAQLNEAEGIVSDFGFSIRSAFFSLIGQWDSIGRTAPDVLLNLSLPLLGSWEFHYDFTQWDDLIQFFRALCAIMIWLWLCFAVSRLLGDMFNVG